MKKILVISLLAILFVFTIYSTYMLQQWDAQLKTWKMAVKERDAVIVDLQQQIAAIPDHTVSQEQSSPLPRPTTSPEDASIFDAVYDFRQTIWGISREDVLKSEKEPPAADKLNIEGFHYLAYPVNMAIDAVTHDMGVIYYFVDDQLFSAKYKIHTEHSNRNDFLADFESIKTVIRKKYGEPREETNWKNDLWKDDREYWGMAIEKGHLEKFAFWETERTEIRLQLTGENYEIHLSVRYESKDPALKRMVDKHTEKYEQESF